MIMPLVINRNNGIKKTPQLNLALLNMTKRQGNDAILQLISRQLCKEMYQLGNFTIGN